MSRTLRWFMPGFVLVLFVAALNGLDDAPFSNRESLGRLCLRGGHVDVRLVVRSCSSAAAPDFPSLELASRGWIIQFRPFWLDLIALLLVFAGFAIGGHFCCCRVLRGRLAASFSCFSALS